MTDPSGSGAASAPIIDLPRLSATRYLILATLRSSFLPQAYAAVPPLWSLTLLTATCAPAVRVLALTLLAWATFTFPGRWIGRWIRACSPYSLGCRRR
jgi:hypothetical protein